jgi:uncharacterized protein YbjT (DUF2867 family)
MALGRTLWCQSRLSAARTGWGLRQGVTATTAIVHCATDPRNAGAVDVAGTGRLLAAARCTGRPHLVYISIAGIDRIPTEYYRAKLAAERAIVGSDSPGPSCGPRSSTSSSWTSPRPAVAGPSWNYPSPVPRSRRYGTAPISPRATAPAVAPGRSSSPVRPRPTC